MEVTGLIWKKKIAQHPNKKVKNIYTHTHPRIERHITHPTNTAFITIHTPVWEHTMSNVWAVGTGKHIRVFEKLDGVLVGHKCVISCVREGSVLVKVMGGLYRGHTKEVSLEKDEWVLLRRTCHEDISQEKPSPSV